jgi:hypothetical protein
MELDLKQQKQIMDLVILLLEGEASGEDLQQLKDILDASSEARDYYLKALMAAECIRKIDWGALNFESEYAQYETINAQMWNALSLEEKTAPNVEIRDISEESAGKKVLTETRTARPSVSKVSLFSLLLSSAALIFVIAYGTIVSMKRGVEVATLTDSLQARWAEPTMSIPKDGRLSTEQRFVLINGFAAVKTDQGVELTFEAPAEFKMMSNGDLQLKSGQVYARVAPQGFGFTVSTPNSKIIDLGTEFGVRAEAAGSSDVYVFKGKVQLFAGPKEQAKTGRVVMENKAVRYDAASRRIDEIPFEERGFVRSIDSKTNTTWRGRTQIDLADIVGGGNGSGSGGRNMAISWDGGKLVPVREISPTSSVSQSYIPVHFSPFIDGVFVPTSSSKAVNLSSETAELNLDEFLKQDSNGLITLIVLRESSDDALSCWFRSKEGSDGDRSRMPFLSFPKGANGQSVIVATADGRGADTCIVNDVRNPSRRRYGASSLLPCRFIKNERMRMLYLRFDISGVKDVSGAVLNLCLDSGNRKRTLSVYGLKDGPSDFWDEETLHYDTAPGLKAASLGNYEFDETLCIRLGTLRTVDNRGVSKPIPVTSDGTLRWSAPEPLDQTAYAITNADGLPVPSAFDKRIPLRFAGRLCGEPDNPSILMHANAGITFDLDAIRKVYGPLKLFTALCGAASLDALEEVQEGDSPSASFYVLLDGEEVFSAVDLGPEDEPQAIEVRLTDQQHYLTLIAAQGTDRSIDNDLCLFVKPRIHIDNVIE